jgi:hypothetical protein
VNNTKIENYKAEIKEKDLLIIAPFKINECISFKDEHFDEILLFNKPV